MKFNNSKILQQLIISACGSNLKSNEKGDSEKFSSIALAINKDSAEKCTATIISPLWVLTSASCIGKSKNWILFSGSSLFNESAIRMTDISQVKNVVSFSQVIY